MKLYRLIAALFLAVFSSIQADSDTRLPKLPDGMMAPHERAAYILLHIWDFPENLSTPEKAEQAISDFLSVADADIASQDAYTTAVDTLMAKANAAGIDILTIAAKYTSYPDAPFFDDELYLPFIDAALATPTLLESTPGLKDRLQYDRACILKNRIGTKAASFIVELPSGEKTPVDSLFKSPLNLLVLFDPDCDHCRDMLSGLSASTSLAQAVDNKSISVTTVWIDALDSPGTLSIPTAEGWNVVSDRTGIMDNELYELPVMPSVYVIDNNGVVVNKNLVKFATVISALGLSE